MLPVRAGLAPDDRPGLVIYTPALQVYVLAVALHIQLLQVHAQAVEILIIGQNSYRLRAEKVVIPDAEQAQDYRKVALQGRRAKMLVHFVKTGEHLRETFGTNSNHEREADRSEEHTSELQSRENLVCRLL